MITVEKKINYHFITDDKQLAACCDNITAKIIALDTEFIRTRTYKAQLGLIQLYDDECVYLIDPLSIQQWQPFIRLLTEPSIMKILFACKEDLDVLMWHLGVLPTPYIDIQIAATFTGEPVSSGLSSLIERYLNVSLDKTESQTDWLARPLTASQCHYAAADVYYLLPLAREILAKVEKNSEHMALLTRECEEISQIYTMTQDSALAYYEIAQAWRLRDCHLAYLQKLAQWRLNYAREHNIALNFVVHEQSLWQIAAHLPKSLAQLTQLGLKGSEIRLHGKTLLDIINTPIDAKACPQQILRINQYPNYKRDMEKLKKHIQTIAEEHHLPVELIASRRQIDRYIAWHHGEKRGKLSDLNKGWRHELCFEKPLFLKNSEENINEERGFIND